MKYLFILLAVFGIAHTSNSQNCGQIVDFRSDMIDNGNGTTTYNFEIDIQATSGGSKSVNVTISCPNNTFVQNSCHESFATLTTVSFGPFTVPTCTGAITLNWTGHSNANCGGTTCASGVQSLPVEYVFFDAKLKEKDVELSWVTASEINNEGFEIQKSSNAFEWQTIGWINGAGNSQERQDYQFIDKDPFDGNNYYRLKQIDFDGNFEYSTLQSIRFEPENSILEVFPNPVVNTMRLKGIDNDISTIKIVDNIGQTLLIIEHPDKAIDLSHLKQGMYYLIVQSNYKTMVETIIKL